MLTLKVRKYLIVRNLKRSRAMITAKITSKGQITIPKKIRSILNSDVVGFSVEGNVVKVFPVDSVAGALSAYKKRTQKSSADIRSGVWKEVARGKV
jgi:bifunctional DNA-binding transcriptional regulator/antitoxin component of YhaV-PrlF toxin-antitoxin module